MRTTVEINDALAQRVKALMSERKTTMRALIEEGLRRLVEEREATTTHFKLRDASVGGDGLKPDVQDDRWETLSAHLYPER